MKALEGVKRRGSTLVSGQVFITDIPKSKHWREGLSLVGTLKDSWEVIPVNYNRGRGDAELTYSQFPAYYYDFPWL